MQHTNRFRQKIFNECFTTKTVATKIVLDHLKRSFKGSEFNALLVLGTSVAIYPPGILFMPLAELFFHTIISLVDERFILLSGSLRVLQLTYE